MAPSASAYTDPATSYHSHRPNHNHNYHYNQQSFLPSADSTNSIDSPFSSRFQRAASSNRDSEQPNMTSWASTSSIQAEASFVPTYDDNDDDLDLRPEEHVVALHDFNSNNATCLSFQAGQVIKVYNRDPSGWWDGELNGQRGWFPSNYVDQEAVYVSDDGQNDSYSYDDGHALRSSTNSHTSSDFDHVADYRSVAQPALARERFFLANTSRSSTPTSTSLLDRGDAGVLDPILHAISLLRNAVRGNRVAHFQPSTACVISSVRSVLSATDCLTRESAVLKANPHLARERKAILSELSKLVAQARRASAPMVDETQRNDEMDSMLNSAEHVLANVRNFLRVAVECGVPVPDRRSSVYDDLYVNRTSAHPDVQDRSALSRHELDKTPTPGYPKAPDTAATSRASHSSARQLLYDGNRTSAQHATRSQSDMRSAYASRRHPSDASVESSDGGASAIAQARSLTQRQLNGSDRRAATVAAAVAHHLGMARSRSDSSSESPDSASGHDAVSRNDSAGSGDDEGPPSPVERTPYEIMQRLSVTNDQLLSIIAAFIGHVHTHTSESHASSYAYLIDMTREAVVGVRNLLLVVEAVNNNLVLQQLRPRETSILWDTRENLYEATTQLVTAARIVTSAPSASITAGSAVEAEDKSRLLQAATSVLRTGGECVGAVRLCIDRLDPAFTIGLPEPSRTRYPRATSLMRAAADPDQRDEGDDDSMTRGGEEGEADPMRALRRKNTLSFLGRKATSLSCLKQKYERDELQNGFEDIDEGNFSDEDLVASKLSNASMQRAPRPVPPAKDRSYSSLQTNAQYAQHCGVDARIGETRITSLSNSSGTGSATGSSVGQLSQDASRTSRSTIQSIRSECTGETSARPSLEMVQQGAGAVPDAHTTAQTAAKQLAGSAVDGQSMYREQRGAAISIESRYMAPDYDASDVVCNSEGQVTGATLKALIEKMTPHDTMIEATFSTAFFLCFRMFTSPQELLDALVARFELKPPVDLAMSEGDKSRWHDKKLVPVRLRVLNLLKSWLENHWNPTTDRVILQQLISLAERWAGGGSIAGPAHRLAELARKRLNGATQKTTVLVGNSRGPGSLQRVISSERMKSGLGLAMTDASEMYAPSAFSKGGALPPTSVVSKTLLSNLRSENFERINVLDFDALELARQLTILDSKLYCAIQPEELLGSKFTKETKAAGVCEDVHVKSMSSMSTRITGWISECILGEGDARKRTQLLKFFIKLGDRCEQLNNFHTLMAIQCALNSSTIARLKKTWDGLSTKYRGMMDQQRRAVEHTRNYASYRARLRNTTPPAIPFLGLFLTDLTFCHEGNAPTRPCPSNPDKKLLNFDKYIKISRIVGEVQRFQVPYNLVEVPEMQKFLRGVLDEVQGAQGGRGADDLYRRSLLLEPRAGSKAGAPGSSSTHGSGAASLTGSLAMRQSAAGGGTGENGKLGGLDIFNWRTDKA
ncbi:probable guanyl nucleotide exchange factor Sql2 [Melanopsichium pennsylvanicum]|uniref:Guanyl nucleotide exchange factor Sql2 n=2 Tax=Melanopsichium pennsylvanicum TaxID=63383 RepID=A0A077R0J1_9BASI|nr:guanyl nucleotide exchange factor Sql2 [Melanopsichium pennsylvanicum 4]SNX83382.1 probable guanyl nucleotide exchange factor Sql2 [Melanopsichium pennsylvanicum]